MRRFMFSMCLISVGTCVCLYPWKGVVKVIFEADKVVLTKNEAFVDKRSGHRQMLENNMMMKRKVPSLVDLCVQKAIDNIRYIGDVGETDIHLLDRILPHCAYEQLEHIEKSTEGRDLSQVTDKLWGKFYESHFGAKSTNLVIERMRQKKVSFKWKKLYEAKKRELEDAQQKSLDRMKELYKQEDARKQSRQVKLCTKVPPSSKRGFYGGGLGSSVSNTKSSLMKKAKIEVIKSQEVKNLTAIKKNAVQRNDCAPMRKPGLLPGKDSASTSKHDGSMARRF